MIHPFNGMPCNHKKKKESSFVLLTENGFHDILLIFQNAKHRIMNITWYHMYMKKEGNV